MRSYRLQEASDKVEEFIKKLSGNYGALRRIRLVCKQPSKERSGKCPGDQGQRLAFSTEIKPIRAQ